MKNAKNNTVELREGFTLTEMLVAVGVLGVLSLGVAQVFSLTTRTVAAGRKISNLNAIAAATERQMRKDFSAITREGVLLIHNQYANGGANIELSPDDANPRRRRIDQVVFFTKGASTTAREPMAPDLVVKSQEAMVYYGHGLKRDPSITSGPVLINDDNNQATSFGLPGVNRYASDWTLARRQVVLAPQSTYLRSTSSSPSQDSPWQVGMQPAAASVFRNFNDISTGYGLRGSTSAPEIASGVVDIVAADLTEVRNAFSAVTDGTLSSPRTRVGPTTGQPSLFTQQAQMLELLPTNPALNPVRRMRVETTPPNYLGLDWANALNGDQQAMARADQAMLSSAAFAAHCTEFIVEYSFGQSEPTVGTAGVSRLVPPGATYWHGLPRQIGPGTNADDSDRADVVPYTNLVPARGNVPFTRSFLCRDGATIGTINIQPAMIERPGAANELFALFGQVDPLYSPADLTFPAGTKKLLKDVNNNGNYDRQDGDILNAPDTQPWPWPSMIRITFTLADPSDPTVEQTFQYVFTLPNDKPLPAM